MSFTTQFNIKQNREHDFLWYLILNRITDTKVINGGVWNKDVLGELFNTLINGRETFIQDSRILQFLHFNWRYCNALIFAFMPLYRPSVMIQSICSAILI